MCVCNKLMQFTMSPILHIHSVKKGFSYCTTWYNQYQTQLFICIYQSKNQLFKVNRNICLIILKVFMKLWGHGEEEESNVLYETYTIHTTIKCMNCTRCIAYRCITTSTTKWHKNVNAPWTSSAICKLAKQSNKVQLG